MPPNTTIDLTPASRCSAAAGHRERSPAKLGNKSLDSPWYLRYSQGMDNHPGPETLLEAIRYFKDTDTCLSYMVGLRWPEGVICPTCGSRSVTFLSTRRVWKCREAHARQ